MKNQCTRIRGWWIFRGRCGGLLDYDTAGNAVCEFCGLVAPPMRKPDPPPAPPRPARFDSSGVDPISVLDRLWRLGGSASTLEIARTLPSCPVVQVHAAADCLVEHGFVTSRSAPGGEDRGGRPRRILEVIRTTTSPCSCGHPPAHSPEVHEPDGYIIG